MAKTKRKGESLGGYFRQVFVENPDWIKIKSNDLIEARYEADHPGQKWNPRVRGNMSNIKSLLRKQARKRGPKPAGSSKVRKAERSIHGLEDLELAIDNCLSAARLMDQSGLETVINHLRRARNELVWKMGQT